MGDTHAHVLKSCQRAVSGTFLTPVCTFATASIAQQSITNGLQLPEDVVLLLLDCLQPLLAATVCWTLRSAVLAARACASIGELKIDVAIERCGCLRERVDLVNTAIDHGMQCNLYLGPKLDPFYHGPPVQQPYNKYVGATRLLTDHSYYGPSQLVGIQSRKTNRQVHVVPLEMSINLMPHPPEGGKLAMSLTTIQFPRLFPGLPFQWQSDPYECMNLHGRLANPLNTDVQLTHAGDHSASLMADKASYIVQKTLIQDHFYWHEHCPWWQCVTYVTIAPRLSS